MQVWRLCRKYSLSPFIFSHIYDPLTHIIWFNYRVNAYIEYQILCTHSWSPHPKRGSSSGNNSLLRNHLKSVYTGLPVLWLCPTVPHLGDSLWRSQRVLRSFRENPEARRLALIFTVVYFAQGMWYLPNLSLTFLLKETWHLSAGQTADFFAITIIPWLIKPVYGLLSDFVPLFGWRRRGYFLLTTGLAAAMGCLLSSLHTYTYGQVALYFTLMGLGLAFSDVLTDAMMVENGQRLALTGPFQAIQWASISAASIVVGAAGGRLAEHAPLSRIFLIAAIFPMISFGMGVWAVREPRVHAGERQFRATWQAIRGAIRSRHLWHCRRLHLLLQLQSVLRPGAHLLCHRHAPLLQDLPRGSWSP